MIEWAKQQNLIGLMLETQDTNVAECRFLVLQISIVPAKMSKFQPGD